MNGERLPLVVHQLEEDQRQNRASCIYWKLLLACELHENENDEGEEMQSNSRSRDTIMLTEWRLL